ncbi:MAG: hypothetical protein JNJ83_12155 [Verrucomicrobiaceae bacterium]|nr:hypothetical protein [Verrucomicrobiaceae bacterium]
MQTATFQSRHFTYLLLWILVGFLCSSDRVRAAIGDAWTAVPTPTSSGLESVIWTGSTYLAVGEQGTIITSPDGVNWTTQFTPTFQKLLNVASSGTFHVAVGENGTLLTSSSLNGSNWVARTSGLTTGQHINGVCWTGSQFIFVANGGLLRTSPDGITWTARTSGTAQHLNNVSWLGTTAIAVGNAGTILTSTDGITWTARTSGQPTASFYDAVQTSSTTVVVGTQGTIVTSTTLSTWTKATIGTTNWLGGVTWTGSRLIVVGVSGTIFTSTASAITWTERPSGVVNWLSGVASFNNRAVACGESGVLMISDASSLTVDFGTTPVFVREDEGTARFIVRLSAAAKSLVTVPYTLTGSATAGADYTVPGSSVSFNVGEISKTIAFPILTDAVAEGDETLQVTLGAPTGALNGFDSVRSAVIRDVSPQIHFDRFTYVVNEEAGSAQIALELDRTSSSPVTVSFGSLASGDSMAAAPGIDYTIPSAVVIPAGTLRFNLNVPVTDDAQVEGDEIIELTLASAAGGTIASPSMCRIQIKDNDAAPALGRDWVTRSPLPATSDFNAIASSNARVVAVGAGGNIHSSLDGITWTPRTSGVLDDLEHVVWTNTQFVAVGDNGTVVTSTDGLSWTVRQRYDEADIDDVVWDGTRIIAVGYGHDSPVVLTSSNGAVSWTVRKLPDFARRLVWTDGTLVSVDNFGDIMTSTNAEDWAVQKSSPLSYASALCYNGSRIVALERYGDNIYTSPDGITWTLRTNPVVNGWRECAWTGAQFVAVSDDGVAATSPDGITWTERVVNRGERTHTVASTTAGIMIGGVSGHIYGSLDGVTWNSRTMTGTGKDLHTVTWTGSQFVALGRAGLVLTSPDGLGWTERAINTTLTPLVVAGNATRTVAWGANVFWHSADAITWTQVALADFTPNGLAASSALFVAIGYNTTTLAGRVFTSTNGSTWTERTISGNPVLRGLTFNGSVWCAVGELGRIYTSADGTTWTQRTSPNSFVSWTSVAWNGSEFLVLGDGYSARSTNGVTWTLDSGDVLIGYEVLAAGSLFVSSSHFTGQFSVTAQPGKIARTLPLLPPEELSDFVIIDPDEDTAPAMAWNGTRLVAVGPAGRILTSQGNDPRMLLAHFQIPSTSVTEGQTNISVVVEMGDASSSTISIPFYLGGGATAGTDVILHTNSPLVFNPGQTTKTITLSVPEDMENEAAEVAVISLGTPTGAQTVTLVTPLNHNLNIAANTTRTVQFSSVSSGLTEEATNHNVAVTLSKPATSQIVVPLLMVAGSATAGVDYNILLPWIVFNPGESTRNLPIQVLEDLWSESDETVGLTLGSPFGTNTLTGTNTTHIVTITDDDLAPVILSQSPPQVVVSSGTVTLSATASGAGSLQWQWFKNGDAISPGGSEQQLTLAGLNPNEAHDYKVRVTNSFGTAISSNIQVTVLPAVGQTVPVKRGATATFSMNVHGSGLSYQWTRNGSDIGPSGGFLGAQTSILSFTASDANVGDYRCRVSIGSQSATSGPSTLVVPSLSQVDPVFFGAHLLGEELNFNVSASDYPSGIIVSGLPPGVFFDTALSSIRGRARKVGTYSVRIQAQNVEGSGIPFIGTLTILPVPASLLGNYVARIQPDSAINGGLGARLDLTMLSTAMLTGKYTSRSISVPIIADVTTSLSGSSTAMFQAIDPVGGLLSFNVQIQQSGERFGVEVTNSSSHTVNSVGWRNVWTSKNRPASHYRGYHTLLLPAASGESMPQGFGFGTLTVTATGTSTTVLKCGDGAASTSNAFISPSGEIFFQHPLYTGSGSVSGTLEIIEDPGALYANNLLSGTATWTRLPQPPGTRAYPAGFQVGPDVLAIRGSRYAALPAGRNILDVADAADNALVQFTHSSAMGIHDASTNIRLGRTNIIRLYPAGDPANPARITLTVNPSTGTFTSTCTLLDPDPLNPVLKVKRLVTSYGVIIRDVAADTRSGYGWFTLPDLANPVAMPPTNSLNSPIRSGAVHFVPIY